MDDGTTGHHTTSHRLPTIPADGAPAADSSSRVAPEPVAAEAAAPAAAGTRARGRRRAGGRGAGPGGGERAPWLLAWVPLPVVLAVQAILSLRLIHADTAFQDEALYLWAGHREWAHWLHGAPIPPFPAYFSGAPVIYPPLGALADSAGGLAGARILSLAFMLAATTLLWATARRLFGRRAAFFAAALFAIAGPTVHLGAFATYDALSIALIAAAAWCAVRAADRADATGWMLAAGIALALANATAYATVLLDPVVIVLAYLVACPRPGGKAALARAATLLTVAVALLVAGALIGGGSYLSGISQTTVARVGGADPALSVLQGAWSWTGLIVVAAVIGAVLSYARYRGRPQTWLLALLAVAALLAPLDQAVLHTSASLNKHVDAGAWLAAIAAGYAVEQFIAAAHDRRTRATVCGACVVALILPLSIGVGQARAFATAWPDSASFVAIFRPLADRGSGRLLVEDPSIAEYYLPAGAQWQRWSSTRNIVLPGGASTGGPSRAAGIVGNGDPAAFARFIRRGYFSLVALNFADTTALDLAIRADLRAGGYHIIQVVPYGTGTYVIFARGKRS
jgi:Dolichyl-phosphate-mannose-protein mannosyltransferase